MMQRTSCRYPLSCCALFGHPDEDELTARDIHAMHLGFAWDGAGYHAIITRDGICHPRRGILAKRTCKGRNHDSVGVCLIGRHNFTQTSLPPLKRCC